MAAPVVRRPSRVVLSLLLLGLTTNACSYFRSAEPLSEPVELIAVLPIDRVDDNKSDADGPRLAPNAEKVVTAQIYNVLASSSRWRFVPDLTVIDALRKLDRMETRRLRAVQLGRAVHADAVLCGGVSRFIERVGKEYGARSPAAVSIALQLVSTKSGDLLWEGNFDKTQEALSSNLFNWWMFWDQGPRWLTAEELSHVGVERLLAELDQRMPE